MKEDYTIKTFFVHIKQRLKLRHLLILGVLLAANTFAWFIYANQVDGGMSAKIKAWNVDFEVNGDSGVRYILFNVDEIYPGMEEFTQSVTIKNHGETSARLEYEVESATILGETTEASIDGAVTPALLLNSLKNDYPFSINPTFSAPVINPEETVTFTFKFNWPYESGDDAEDTSWGSRAYDFSQTNPTTPSITINMKLTATQINE